MRHFKNARALARQRQDEVLQLYESGKHRPREIINRFNLSSGTFYKMLKSARERREQAREAAE